MTDGPAPSFLELAQQALSSTREGYELLASKFEATDYATPETWIQSSLSWALQESPKTLSPVRRGLDLACGTGRATRVLGQYCDQVVGIDFSPAMLAQASRLSQDLDGLSWLESELSELQLEPESFDLIVTFGAWGHILPSFRQQLLSQILHALKKDGIFVTLTADRADAWEKRYWYTLLFDGAIKIRNKLWFKEFHMYYGLNNTQELVGEFQSLKGSQVQVALGRLPEEPNHPLSILRVQRL